MKTPAQFGFALSGWLRSNTPYQLLEGAIPGALWTQGGCAYLAGALLKWAGGQGGLSAVWGRSDAAPVTSPVTVQHIL